MSALFAAADRRIVAEQPFDRAEWESGAATVTRNQFTLRRLLAQALWAMAPCDWPATDVMRVEAGTYRDADLAGECGNCWPCSSTTCPVQVEHTIINPRTGTCDKDNWNQRCAAGAATTSPLAAHQIHAWFALRADTDYVTEKPDPEDPTRHRLNDTLRDTTCPIMADRMQDKLRREHASVSGAAIVSHTTSVEIDQRHPGPGHTG
ncbi:hypothetical protein [Kutzneria sp. 744]|uniref:hypothetical protein n=1 Tax=Kutzneria sp. (strain 744) TaxID=345341 RepID=UPI0003EED0C9|nr:hypothetical protein [Kutzneria sp. 744]EWM19629.1 hypothetical protein KUTG_09933 [Kutzneria sp. 744]